MLITLVIISLYGRHLTKSYIVAPKCAFQTIPQLKHWLANAFSSFFIRKIALIRSSFSSGACSDVLNPPVTGMVSQNLTYVTDDEVRHLVLSAPCKSSDLDPVPTSLVKDCIYILVTPIASIVTITYQYLKDVLLLTSSVPSVEEAHAE